MNADECRVAAGRRGSQRRRVLARPVLARLFSVAALLLVAALPACGSAEPVRQPAATGTKGRKLAPPAPVDYAPAVPPPSYQPPPVYVPPAPPPVVKQGDVRGLRVVIDAGHGGKDPGATSVAGGYEKAVVLDVALEVARILRSKGALVTLTRDRDVFIELDARAALAERNRADFFVSIHADAIASKSISGATIYHARQASAKSRTLARAVEKSLKAAGFSVRGIRSADYRVIAGHSRPAILVECGYLTNATDAANLAKDAYRDKIAAAIAKGIEGATAQ
jgi:N-acetylmuramoyl-L-alanine amidase